MSFKGYSDAMASVGGGFLEVLVDMSGNGGRAYTESMLHFLPLIFIFLILSAVGAVFDFISYSTALGYSLLLLIGLALLRRLRNTLKSWAVRTS